MAGRGQARTMPAWMEERAPAPAWGPRTPPVVPPDWEGPDPRNKLSGADRVPEPSEADSLPPKRQREPWERSASSQGDVSRGQREGDEMHHWKRPKVSRPSSVSPPSQHSGLASGLADLKNGLAANRAGRTRQSSSAENQHRATSAQFVCPFAAKFAVDPHVKGHDGEYKRPMTKVVAPKEIAAIRTDRKTGEVTFSKACQVVAIDAAQPGEDLTLQRSGSEMCGSEPIGLQNIEAALAQVTESGDDGASPAFDFVCDAGSLQRLLSTPYEPDKDWVLHVHVRQDPCCVSFEGCPSPLEEAGPDEVPTERWVQWGRNLKRACAGGVMAKQHAILKSKLAELRCAIVTPRIGRDKRHPALLVPLAPVPASSNATQESISADSGLAARTQLYREKTLLHCWIECFLTGTPVALIGQCHYTCSEDGKPQTAVLHKLRPTETREMYRVARDNKLWDWNNCVYFGAEVLRWLLQSAKANPAGNYTLRYRSARRELQLLSD